MKRILTIQDISCLGKCSVTVALPVLSAMGVETAVLPTAVLSTHTAFEKPAVCDLTAQMRPTIDHWMQIGASFHGIYTGYLGDVRQVDVVLALQERFQPELLFVDPVMGDHGRLYSGIDMAYVEKMRQLCAVADVIVPNVTEACLLTQTPYPEMLSDCVISRLLEKLLALGCDCAMITGAATEPGKTGVACLNQAGETFTYTREKLPQSYHGTGDLFSSACAGALLLGKKLPDAAKLAADFTAQCIRCTPEEGRDQRYGVCFEKALPYLWNNL